MARNNTSKAAAGSVQPAEAQAARQNILDAALEMFAAIGFDGAAISAVAQRCGVSTALVHYHFSSKAELWKAAVEMGMTDVLRDLSLPDDDLADLDAVMRLKFFIRRYINYFARKPFIFQVLIKESDLQSDRFAWLQANYLRAFYDLWIEPIRRLRDAGLLRVQAPDYHLALIAVGACHHFLTSRYRALPVYGVDPEDPEAIRRHADLAVDVIVHGITTGS
jgi:AcrR family transcriptional regulator